MVVETVCGGLEVRARASPLASAPTGAASPQGRGRDYTSAPWRENDLMKRLMWSGLLAAIGALASDRGEPCRRRVWRRIFDEDPPD